MTTATVRLIIDTLYRSFGRADIILDNLIEKDLRLDQVMKLSASDEGLCAMLENSMLAAHLNNPQFSKELISHFQCIVHFSGNHHETKELHKMSSILMKI